MGAQFRRIFAWAVRTAAVALAALVLLELTARVVLFGASGLVPERVDSVHGLFETGFTRPSAVPGLGFELAPKVSGWFKLVPFRTNSVGMRDEEVPLHKPDGTYRIAVVGASFALPAGVAIERAFHTLLEERLSREWAPLRVECLNFAVGMYHPRQSLAMLEGRALAYAPDLVIFTATNLSAPLLLVDPAEEARRFAAEGGAGLAALRFRRTHPFLRSYLYRLVRARAWPGEKVPQPDLGLLERAYLGASEAIGGGRAPTPAGSGSGPLALPRVERDPVIDRLARVGRREGLPIVIARLEFDPAPPSAADEALAVRARELGLGWVDTRAAFEGRSPREFWIYELDPHPNANAHGLFAGRIASFLASHAPAVPAVPASE